MVQASGGVNLSAKYIAESKGREFVAINPATGKSVGPIYRTAVAAELETAAKLAYDAASPFGKLPGAARARFLRAIAARIDAIVDDLVDRVGDGTGLPESRVRGETARTTNQLRLFAGIVQEGSWVDARIDPGVPDRKPMPRARHSIHAIAGRASGSLRGRKFSASIFRCWRRHCFCAGGWLPCNC